VLGVAEVEDDFNVLNASEAGRRATAGSEKAATGALIETSPRTAASRSMPGADARVRRVREHDVNERNSLLNTRFATFLNVDWANAQAVN
jgi:hypothetical protein